MLEDEPYSNNLESYLASLHPELVIYFYAMIGVLVHSYMFGSLMDLPRWWFNIVCHIMISVQESLVVNENALTVET